MKDPLILLADDHSLFRYGVATLIKSSNRNFRILEATNGKEAIEFCNEQEVDLMILDINMPIVNGLKVIKHLRIRRQRIKTIVLTVYDEDALIYNLLKLGTEGYLYKGLLPNEIMDAIDVVLNGGIYYPQRFNERIKTLIYSGSMPIADLSDSEIQMIKFLSLGHTSKEIALKMNYTVRTVETKKTRLQKKLLAKNSVEIVSIAMRMGLIS